MRIWLMLALPGLALGQTLFQQTNPNYPVRNPFYFEGKVTWEKLGIVTPSNSWEFVQRGIHRQDDLEDLDGAKADYAKALETNSLRNGTCQIVTSVPASGFGELDPAPCMFTVRLRLAYLLRKDDPAQAIQLFQEVLEIDPLRLEVNQMIGEVYMIQADYSKAVAAFQAELALSPVTPQTIALTGDEANNAHTHWALAGAYAKLGQYGEAINQLEDYLKATKWHSDVYPWRIALASKRIEQFRSRLNE